MILKEPLLAEIISLETDRDCTNTKKESSETEQFSILPWKSGGNKAHAGAIGNFGVEYNLCVLVEAFFIFGNAEDLNHESRSLLHTLLLVGCMVGAVVIGFVADKKGRDGAMVSTLAILAVGAFSLSLFTWGPSNTIYYVIAMSMFIIGFGIGGVYPVYAAFSREEGGDLDHTCKSIQTAKGYFWRLPGSLFVLLVSVVLFYVPMADESRWRILFGIGVIFPLYSIFKIGTCYSEKNIEYEASRRKMQQDFAHVFCEPQNMKNLLVTGGCWFISDAIFFGVIFATPDIIAQLWPGASFESRVFHSMIPITCAMAFAIVANHCLKEYGTRLVQMWGFVSVGVTLFLLGMSSLTNASPSFLLFLYSMLFCTLWLPYVTTYIICGESYTPEVRGTFTGISAAIGKLGAIIGCYYFHEVLLANGLGFCFITASAVAVIGALATKYCMESEDDRCHRNYRIRKIASANRRTVTILTDITSIRHRSFTVSNDRHNDSGDEGIHIQNVCGDFSTHGSEMYTNEFNTRGSVDINDFLTLSIAKGMLQREQSLVYEQDGDEFVPLPSDGYNSAEEEELLHPWIAPIEDIVRSRVYLGRTRAVSLGTGSGMILAPASTGVLQTGVKAIHITDFDALEKEGKKTGKVLDAEKLRQEIVGRLTRDKAEELLHREGCEQYVPFFEWQRSFLNWIHHNFNHPLFRQWNYIWHLVPKTPVQLMLHSFILGIGPGTVVESFYIVILGHVLWSGPWLIKDFFQVPRPSWVLPFGFNLAISERNWSFPSGHTMGLSGTFLLLALIFGDGIGILWFVYVLMTLLTCLARTALRMHWPLDTFGSCLMAPCIVLPLFFGRHLIFHNHISNSLDMLTAAIIVFSFFFLTHAFAHIYVKTFLPVPSIVAHIANDPKKFKYTNVMGGMRNSLFLLGVGLGIFTIWQVRDPNNPICPFDTGLEPALMAAFTTGTLLLVQNFFRSWWFETKAWTSNDYYIKFFFAPVIGYMAILNAAGVLTFKAESIKVFGA